MGLPPFRFKRFSVDQNGAAHPTGTDGVLLGAWADIRGVRTVLDIGTGTGLIALMVAQRTESTANVEITGIEIQEKSATCAQRNFLASPWADSLQAIHAPVQEYARISKKKFDLIVCNPPYFSSGPPAPEPSRRLVRSAAALKANILLDAVVQLLAPGGRFCAIFPPLEGQQAIELGACQGLYCTRSTAVFTRIGKPVERLLLQLEFRPYDFERKSIAIYQANETYTIDFRNLTKAFYLDF